MLYGFTVTPTINVGEANTNTNYFDAVQSLASLAVQIAEPTAAEVLNLCEYLDSVDAGSMKNTPSLYKAAVVALSNYLGTCSHQEGLALSEKSWAAKTLFDLSSEVSLMPEVSLAMVAQMYA